MITQQNAPPQQQTGATVAIPNTSGSIYKNVSVKTLALR